MLKTFHVQVFSDIKYPSPIMKIEALSFGTAGRRGMDKYRIKHRGRKIKVMTARVTQI